MLNILALVNYIPPNVLHLEISIEAWTQDILWKHFIIFQGENIFVYPEFFKYNISMFPQILKLILPIDLKLHILSI